MSYESNLELYQQGPYWDVVLGRDDLSDEQRTIAYFRRAEQYLDESTFDLALLDFEQVVLRAPPGSLLLSSALEGIKRCGAVKASLSRVCAEARPTKDLAEVIRNVMSYTPQLAVSEASDGTTICLLLRASCGLDEVSDSDQTLQRHVGYLKRQLGKHSETLSDLLTHDIPAGYCYKPLTRSFPVVVASLLISSEQKPLLRDTIRQLALLGLAFQLSAMSLFEIDSKRMPQPLVPLEGAFAAIIDSTLIPIVAATCYEVLNYLQNRQGQVESHVEVAKLRFVEAARLSYRAFNLVPKARYAKYISENVYLVGDVCRSEELQTLAAVIFVEGYCAKYLSALVNRASNLVSIKIEKAIDLGKEVAFWVSIPKFCEDTKFAARLVSAKIRGTRMNQNLTADLMAGVLLLRQLIGLKVDAAVQIELLREGSAGRRLFETNNPVFTTDPLFWLWCVLQGLVLAGNEDGGGWSDPALRLGSQKLDAVMAERLIDLVLEFRSFLSDGHHISIRSLPSAAACVYYQALNAARGSQSPESLAFLEATFEQMSNGRDLEGVR